MGRVIAAEPLIYAPEDVSSVEDVPDSATQPDELELDINRQPWLRGFDERALANLAVALTDFICRPSFGARTKREIEFKLFAELKERQPDWTSLGAVADDLAIARSRARTLALEYRARRVGGEGHGARRRILREEVGRWPHLQIEQDNDKLKIVIDDPFVRDLLKNHAYARGILLDQSFAAEIQTFSWDSYARLLEGLYSEGTTMADSDFLSLTSALRRQVRTTAARSAAAQAELDAQLGAIEKLAQEARKSKGEKRRELVLELLKRYGPALAGVAGRAAFPSP